MAAMWRSRILPTARTTSFTKAPRPDPLPARRGEGDRSQRAVVRVGLGDRRFGGHVERHARRLDPQALEVVEFAHGMVEDVDDDAAEVEQRPAAVAHALLAE